MLLLILFFCQEWKVRYHYREVYLHAYNLFNVTSIRCKFNEDSKIYNGLIYLNDETRSVTRLKYVCMYACIYLQLLKIF